MSHASQNSTSRVSIRACNSYEPGTVQQSIAKCIEDLGGSNCFIKSGDKVLLKPNLLKSADPSEAVVTHPQVIESIAEMVIDCGAKPYIGDSPPLGNLQRVLSRSGYDTFMKKLGIDYVPFLEKETYHFGEDDLFKRIELASELRNFDTIINLPKCKTHTQMGLTLAVKNLFGTVIGTDKASWHMRAGKDLDTFATVLVQIYQTFNPRLSIIDAVLGMEGNGPNSGDPRHLGFIAASEDPVALDSVICEMLGFDVNNLRTCIIGAQRGLGTLDPEKIAVLGDDLPGFPLKDFVPPKSKTMTWNFSRLNPIRRFMENHIITKPDIDVNACEACGICEKHCPPKAIKQENGRMVINRKKCISCFCCHELCSNNAIKIVEPFWGKVIGKMSC